MAKILIVDDDKSILRLLEFTLQRAGHLVSTYVDGFQGLAAAEVEHPDLIIVDVMMPRMTGYEFCQQARTKPGLETLPIVMFSARFQSIDKEAALEVGATDYLAKTTSPNELLKRIAELLPTTETVSENTAIGLFSLRGGSGLTSLAVNLAVYLAKTQKNSTTLVDLARLGGHTALMLGLRPTGSVSQALAALKHDLTPDSIKPYLLEHSSGVQLLASVSGSNHELLLTDRRLAQLVTTLKSLFSFTVLDLPHILEAKFAPTLQLVNKITLVLSPDQPSLYSTTMALQGLARLGIPPDKIGLVVNYTIPEHALPLEIIEETLKHPIIASIPFEAAMVRAVNKGMPLMLDSPESAGAKAIANLAEILVNT
jgi:CheY-like chemotaxis protein/MinD-like ATPase involved in chromosome partitioning or flagellar assembly